MIFSSNDPKILNHSSIEKDKIGHAVLYFHGYALRKHYAELMVENLIRIAE